MHRRFTTKLALLAIATLVLALVAPAGATAQAQRRIAVHGGTTTLTTSTVLVKKLLGAKIVAFVTSPATQSLRTTKTGPALVARYPVTRGTIAQHPLRGQYGHRGGLFITNLNNNKSVAVDNLIVNTKLKVLTAHVVGLPKSVQPTVFRLNFTKASILVRSGFVQISRIGVTLDKNAASLLNSALGTTVFKSGMAFGTAVSRLDR